VVLVDHPASLDLQDLQDHWDLTDLLDLLDNPERTRDLVEPDQQDLSGL